MKERNIIWYRRICPYCRRVETGFYDEPNVNATFTCRLCNNDLLIVKVDYENHEMVCEDMNEIIKNEIENYRKNHYTIQTDGEIRRSFFYAQKIVQAL